MAADQKAATQHEGKRGECTLTSSVEETTEQHGLATLLVTHVTPFSLSVLTTSTTGTVVHKPAVVVETRQQVSTSGTDVP